MYVSLDDGDHWQPLQLNLPVTSVRDIDVHGDDVVIATHGRAFWVIDDVTPLRQSTPRPRAPALACSRRPRRSASARPDSPARRCRRTSRWRRIRRSARTSTTCSKAAATQPVTIEILDAKDALVRRYSSADVAAAVPTSRRSAPRRSGSQPASTLVATPGHAPLRLAAALRRRPRRWRTTPGADGVWAPPGRYTVVLEVDGARLTRPLTVVPDPRVSLRPRPTPDSSRWRAASRRSGPGWPRPSARSARRERRSPSGARARAPRPPRPSKRYRIASARSWARRRRASGGCPRDAAACATWEERWTRSPPPWTAPTPRPRRTPSRDSTRRGRRSTLLRGLGDIQGEGAGGARRPLSPWRSRHIPGLRDMSRDFATYPWASRHIQGLRDISADFTTYPDTTRHIYRLRDISRNNATYL